ncbi:hypothetical protein SAMN04489761_1703 [Tenacibaculum sp. MAR_2009_124]|uniref:hypothetical protein n=1 Tax=Tenacibaculum sp. MAR_2009_124 TaxID=1250059 RepID=UPI00089786F7|nr:hypothetical protein [Tenacibaculum sp. MAR_2009_124]SEB76541.1 hypothetical protein SAMN04489761_1703 [Tenacibaculum sp. MAR_2009_124]
MKITMSYQNLKTACLLTAMAFVGISCSKNEDVPNDKGSLSVSAKSTLNQTAGRSATDQTDFEITKFLLNVKEFELELDVEDNEDSAANDDQWDDDGVLGFDDEIELNGPFEINLLENQVTFLDVELPTGQFEELEFKFAPSTNENSLLFEKSILIKGNIQGTPFIFWHNFEEEVEIDFENPELDIQVSQVEESIVIDFDLNQVFDLTTGVDLTTATDGNNDGTIEISPSDADGNNQLADAIVEAIKTAIDLLDE